MNTIHRRFIFVLVFSVACLPNSLRAAVVKPVSLAPAFGMMASVPAFRASVLSQISLVTSLSAQPIPTLTPLLTAAPTPVDPWQAEAARLVGALVASPQAVVLHQAELRAALGDAGSEQLLKASVSLRAAEGPELLAQLKILRSGLDLDNAGSIQEFGSRLNAFFENSNSGANKPESAAEGTPAGVVDENSFARRNARLTRPSASPFQNGTGRPIAPPPPPVPSPRARYGKAAKPAAAPGSAAPMAQYSALRRGVIPAALAFLHTPALQDWLWASRPAQAKSVLGWAHRLADFGQVTRAYNSDPSGMRRALLAGEDENMIDEPRQFAKIFAANPLLEGSVEAARQAAVSWDTLEDQERRALVALGHSETTWRDYKLTRRVDILRGIWLKWAEAALPKSVLDPAYASTLRAILKRADGYFSQQESRSLEQTAARAERLAAKVAEVRARAEASGNEAALRGLAYVAEQNNVNQARAAFERVFAGADGGAVQTEIPPSVPEAILSELATRLPAAIRALAEGTPAATVLDDAERMKPLRVAFVELPAGVGGRYSDDENLIELGEETVSQMLRAEGRSAGELLADPALLGRYVLAVAPVFIHEATHARQYRLLARQGFARPGALYQQAMEVEAFSVQGAFIRAHTARFPEARMTIQAFSARPELFYLVVGWQTTTDPVKVVRGRYQAVPAGNRAWNAPLRTERSNIDALSYVEAELARRRRLPAAERVRLERDGIDDGKVANMKTSSLRYIVSILNPTSRALVNIVTAANDVIMINARRALKTFYSLRRTLPPDTSTGASPRTVSP